MIHTLRTLVLKQHCKFVRNQTQALCHILTTQTCVASTQYLVLPNMSHKFLSVSVRWFNTICGILFCPYQMPIGVEPSLLNKVETGDQPVVLLTATCN